MLAGKAVGSHLGPLGPQPGTLGLGSTTSGLALARDPGLTHQWASISPGPTEPKPHPPDHGPDASPVNPSPLTSILTALCQPCIDIPRF